MNKTIPIFLILLFTPFFFVFSQGYKIEVTVSDLPEQYLFLGYHYDGEIFKTDSVRTDKNGKAVFAGKENLPGGMYLLYFPDQKYFEFLITESQTFEIFSKKSDFLENVSFKGSKENSLFFEYQRNLNDLYRKRQLLTNKLKEYGADSAYSFSSKIEAINNQISDYKDTFVKEHQGMFVSTIVNATINPKIPSNIKDSIAAYRYFRNNYFENVDFSDSRLLRTTVYPNRLRHFVKNVLPSDYDSINVEINKLLEKTKVNEEIQNYTMSSLYEYLRNSKIITHEISAVYLAEHYFLNPNVNIKPEIRSMMKNYVKILKPNLVGQPARNFEMEDITGKKQVLYNISANYTILYFFEPDCDICKTETPKLKELYKKYKSKNVEVLAIYPYSDTEKWKNYVKTNNLEWINLHDPENISGFREKYNVQGTPLIYLLNKDKMIVIKYITVEQLADLLKKFVGE